MTFNEGFKLNKIENCSLLTATKSKSLLRSTHFHCLSTIGISWPSKVRGSQCWGSQAAGWSSQAACWPYLAPRQGRRGCTCFGAEDFEAIMSLATCVCSGQGWAGAPGLGTFWKALPRWDQRWRTREGQIHAGWSKSEKRNGFYFWHELIVINIIKMWDIHLMIVIKCEM